MNGNLNFQTNDLTRMRLMHTYTGQTINGIGGLDLSGNCGLGDFSTAPLDRPFCKMHLNVGGTQDKGFRSWMDPGYMVTAGSDMAWFGLKTEASDHNYAVLQWADNNSGVTDPFRFIFTRNTGSTDISSQTDGLECARIKPATSGNESFFGIGDYATAGTDPSDRLDLLDGTIRLQSFVSSTTFLYPNSSVDRLLVADPSNGRVYWRPVSSVTNAACDWTINPGATNNHVSTAWDPSTVSGCPDKAEAVGIGVQLTGTAAAKLVLTTDNYDMGAKLTVNPTSTSVTGEQINASGGSATTTGLEVINSGSTAVHNGIHLSTTGASTSNIGLQVNTQGGSGATENIGLKADPLGNSGNWNIGVKVTPSGTSTRVRGLLAETYDATYTGYAAYCVDHSTSAAYSYGVAGVSVGGTTESYGVKGVSSGATINANIGVIGHSEIGGASTSLPPSGSRTGVFGLAKDPEEGTVCYGVYGYAEGPDDTGGTNGHTKWAGYFPGYTYTPGGSWSSSDEQLKENIEPLATDVATEKLMALHPKTYDFNHATYSFMHLPTEHQYGLLAQEVEQVLPDLVTMIHQPAALDSSGNVVNPEVDFKAMNYQSLIPILIAGFQEQQTTIASLQEQLTNCCAANINGGGTQARRAPVEGTPSLQEERLLISPNPFTTQTMLRYYIAAEGRARLEVSTGEGRLLEVLREEHTMMGEHSYDWNTAAMAPGTYFVALVMDGNVVVKRAVKVGER